MAFHFCARRCTGRSPSGGGLATDVPEPDPPKAQKKQGPAPAVLSEHLDHAGRNTRACVHHLVVCYK